MKSTGSRQKALSHTPFLGKFASEYNALRSAIHTAANHAGYVGEYCEYEWLEKVPLDT